MHSAGFQVDLTISFRQHDVAGACCFLTVTEVTVRGQMRVLVSEHITQRDPLALVDAVNARVRHLQMEHYVAVCEPF